MKRFALLMFLFAAPALAQTDAFNGYCHTGASKAVVSGLSSSNIQQGIIPKCTVTVYLTGTTTKATIFTNASNGILTNSFTADVSGQWMFYAATGVGYDVVMNGGTGPNAYGQGTNPVAVALTDLKVGGGGGGGGGACSGTFRQISYFSAQNVCSGDPLFLDNGTDLGGGLNYTGNGAKFDAENSGSYTFIANDPANLNGAANAQFNLSSGGVNSATFGVHLDTSSGSGSQGNSGNINLFTRGNSTNGNNIFLTAIASPPKSASGQIVLEGNSVLLLADGISINLQSVGGINASSGSQAFTFSGGIAPTTRTINFSPYTIRANGETTDFYDASGGSIAATIPSSPSDGLILIQKKIDSSANTVTITAPAGSTIDGASTFVLKFQYQWVALQYDNPAQNWHVFSTGPAYTGALTPNDCLQVNATGNGFVDSGAGCGGGGGGGSAFNALTSGSNTTAAMVVGTGASLLPAGSGVIGATSVGGITITGTPSVGFVPTATSSSSATWQASSAAPSFSTLTSGTNTGAAMVVGTGASLGATGTGTIGATTAVALATAPTVCGANQYAAGVDTGGNALCIALPTQPASQYIAPQAISGCGVEYVSGLTYNVGACTYSINGIIYHSPLTAITLTTADPINPRLDVIFVDTTQTVKVIPGVPGATPQQPVVDPSTQLELTFVLVNAAATTPSNTTLVDIYLEGVEWTGAKGGTNATRINLTSTSNPFSGTHDTEFGAGGTVAATSFAGYTVPSAGTVNLANYNTLTFYLRNKAAWAATNSITVQWFNGTTQMGTGIVISNGAFGFNATTNTSTYQQISIPASTFGIAGTPVTSVRFTVSGSGAALTGFYLDQITLQGGSGGIVLPATLMNFKGSWSSTATYNPNDTVTSGGTGYVALAQNTNVAVTTAATWAPLAPTGVVSSFSAPSASWPIWLTPVVTNPTSSVSLAVTASPIPYSAFAPVANNTVLGALAGTTPSALAMPSCSTSGTSALIWTTGVGFGCNAISGGGGGGNTISTSLTNNFIPKSNGINSIIDSKLSDDGTNLRYAGSGTVNAITILEGTPATPLGGNQILASISSTHTLNLSSNGGAFSPICTVANGLCASGTVTAVTGTSPIVSSGGTAPAISCPTCGVTGSPLSQFAATTSAQLRGVISDESGTGPLLFAGGALGAATATSLLASGNVDGTAPVTITTGTTATLGGTFKSGYTLNQNATAATAVAYTLPTAAAGLQYCVGNSYNGSAATTGVLTVNTSASGQFVIFTDGTLSATGGNVTSGGAAADFACFVGVDATHWYFKPSSGTWTKH